MKPLSSALLLLYGCEYLVHAIRNASTADHCIVLGSPALIGMASPTYRVDLEDIPLNGFNCGEASSNDDDHSRNVNLRRARTDVHLRQRNSQDSTRYYSYDGREHRLQKLLPSQHGGELLSSHTLHYGSDYRPSAWFNTVMARRRKGVSPSTEEEAVNEIADAMEGDEKLMSDDVSGEIMRRETLRELSKPLRIKKEIKRKLTSRRSSHYATSRKITRMKYIKYTLSMQWYKISQSVLDTFHDYSLWHKELKEIEGTFGTGVGSYFRFLRYLFLLNLVIAILVCGFLLTPQLLAHLYHPQLPDHNDTSPSDIDDSEVSITASALRVSDSSPDTNFASKPLVTGYIYSTEKANISNTDQGSEAEFGALDWLTGAGWFDTTELYYGRYSPEDFSLVAGLYYSIPQAYFFVIFLIFIIYLIVILHRVIVLYKNNYIDAEHDMSATFVKKVFSSWDFSITEKKAANIKHKSIYNELKELLQEFLNEEQEEGYLKKLREWCVKLVFWIIILISLGLLGWAMYLMLQNGINQNIIEDTANSGFGQLVYPLIVTCIIIFIPSVFAVLVKLEGYRIPRHRLYVTLIRTILLELTILGVLVGFWYMQATVPMNTATTSLATDFTTDSSLYNINDDFISNKSQMMQSESAVSMETGDCWETSLGQEFYRLLIIDFLVAVVMHAATLIFSMITLKKTLGKIHQYLLEFDISRNTLHLIYNQTLLWAGLFFCPLIPLIVLLKMTIMFYIQKLIVLKCLRPDDRPWRAAQTETVFFALTLVSLILSFFGYGFIIVRGNSSSCGPFQHYSHYIEFLWDLISSDQQTILGVISWIFKPGVVAGILGILVILVYCAKSVAEGRAEMIKVLRRQLELEVRDRAFLLQLTEKVRRGEYKPASPAHVKAASPPPQSCVSHHDLTQRASFVFKDNKVHPADADPQTRLFSDDTGESEL